MFRITTAGLAILLLAMLLMCSGLDRADAQSVGSQYTSTAPKDCHQIGKPSELEYWNGAVVRLGREAKVPTPTHAHIYDCLLPQELHARGKIAFPE